MEGYTKIKVPTSPEEIAKKKQAAIEWAEKVKANNPDWKRKQELLAGQFAKAGSKEKLEVGDIFIKYWMGEPYVEFTKGVVTSIDERGMATYKPTSDGSSDYGFGCTHATLKNTSFAEYRVLENNAAELKKATTPWYGGFPGISLFKNPSYDLVNM